MGWSAVAAGERAVVAWVGGDLEVEVMAMVVAARATPQDRP